MKVNVHGLVFVGFAAAILAGAAHAGDENIVTSKAYTDATYQAKIAGTSGQLVTSSGTSGTVQFTDVTSAGTGISALTSSSSASDKGKIPTAYAVKEAIDTVATTANGAQVASDTNYQLGGANGTWNTVEAGNYITAPSAGVAENSAKFDIDTTKITSSSELAANGTKLAREGDVKGYVDGKIGGNVNSSNTTQAPTGATIAAAIEAAQTENEQTYQPIAGSGHLLGNNGDWETLQNGVGTTISTVAATNDTPGQVKVDINTLNDGTFTNVNGVDSAGQVNNGKIPTASDVKTYVDSQVTATATAHTYTADEVTVHKDANNQFSAKTGAVADNAQTLTTGDQVHDYVADTLAGNGTAGSGYQHTSTANYQIGNSSGTWDTMGNGTYTTWARDANTGAVTVDVNAATSAAGVTPGATTIPTSGAVADAIAAATGNQTIPQKDTATCTAEYPCALVAEGNRLNWRVMAVSANQLTPAGTCGNANDNCGDA